MGSPVVSSFRIKKGLDLPLTGAPTTQNIEKVREPRQVALLGSDYIGMKPSMLVKEGDLVKMGSPLFSCKKTPGEVTFTSPVQGKILAVNRGEKRVFQSLVIEVNGYDQVSFKNYSSKDVEKMDAQAVKDLLLESGQWTAIRQRPFGRVANPEAKASALFITAMDTSPHAPPVELIIRERNEDFQAGVKALSHLTNGPTYVCVKGGSEISVPGFGRVERAEFSGPHPAGCAGLHINHLMKNPVSLTNVVWQVGYQDVLLIGKLFNTGKLDFSRVLSLAGPYAKNPRLIRTWMGARVSDIVEQERKGADCRVVSGGVLHGHHAEASFDFLGRYANQISLVQEGYEREFMGWHMPGMNKFSIKRTFISSLFPAKKFDMTTTTHGSIRAMVPVGMFEKVMPYKDTLPTQLLRALVTKDVDTAIGLGALELTEEDLALCTFASPGKDDFGSILRENLDQIEKEF